MSSSRWFSSLPLSRCSVSNFPLASSSTLSTIAALCASSCLLCSSCACSASVWRTAASSAVSSSRTWISCASTLRRSSSAALSPAFARSSSSGAALACAASTSLRLCASATRARRSAIASSCCCLVCTKPLSRACVSSLIFSAIVWCSPSFPFTMSASARSWSTFSLICIDSWCSSSRLFITSLSCVSSRDSFSCSSLTRSFSGSICVGTWVFSFSFIRFSSWICSLQRWIAP
mmetsp:Transcript_10844/g.25990  ORF Transcript_10844/g.25990 Transcript_10844/m.25990 type:complete len:233 (+) Transcript_10844:1070-1768(+)